MTSNFTRNEIIDLIKDDICLTKKEITKICGGAKLVSKQLEILRERGFWRVWRRNGTVVLERSHYEAVCAGARPGGFERAQDEPQLRPVKIGRYATRNSI